MKPEPIRRAHYETILALNTRFEHWLSPLDKSRLNTLLGHADYARQLKDGRAWLIGYSGQSGYRHKHVDWLSNHYEDYAYIDRVVVDPGLMGQGMARKLYDDFAAYARARGHEYLACEVNTRPNNTASHQAHLKLGFHAVGEADYGPDYSVRYYLKPV